jgi:hypothetical protein
LTQSLPDSKHLIPCYQFVLPLLEMTQRPHWRGRKVWVTVSLSEQRRQQQEIGLELTRLQVKIWKFYPERQHSVFSCTLCTRLRVNQNTAINSPPQSSPYNSPLVPSVWRGMLSTPHEKCWICPVYDVWLQPFEWGTPTMNGDQGTACPGPHGVSADGLAKELVSFTS